MPGEPGQMVAPLLLTLGAGLATGIGSLLALVVKRVSPGTLRLMMGFSAGVMLYVSFTELLGAGIAELGFVGGNLAFFGGIAVMALIDMAIPHEFIAERIPTTGAGGHRVMRAGLLVALGLLIHNFPEGMAVFTLAVSNMALGVSLAIAIALHNIPEGMAIAMPIYAATGNRKTAFTISFLSGLAEPLGALVAFIWLLPVLSPAVLAGLLAAVGGLMTFISFDELLPLSYRKEEGGDREALAHEAIIGVVAGMAVMAVSLGLF